MGFSVKHVPWAVKRRYRSWQAKRGLPPVVVSFTSYPARLKSAIHVAASLREQTILADKIILWLDEGDFQRFGIAKDDVQAAFPSIRTFEIRWVSGDHGSYDKFFWILQQSPESIVITLDDDLVYRPTLIEELLAEHRKFPEAFITTRSHLVGLNESQDDVLPYNDWLPEQREILHRPVNCIFANGGAGALYPPNVFQKDFFDWKVMSQVAPRSDEIWLNAYMWGHKIPKVALDDPYLTFVPGTQDDCLWTENRTNNDTYLQNVYSAYPQVKEALIGYVKAGI